eukprot:CAMPEP_0182915684 /NCGR_PEP_ID=MMETSP0105_2-20130417/476_1 /TAXON_ID=81532 ORGANISM="Acanthoeca-like sp., Strain 10tr" /NCGR_SAMPLE_ID=MMETSP0105_2 /ASSEMBLY_ACC=CAM_ASM_000205 /LENGTH=295 /DNA_ID=CAMNT_0025052565 /DNA_START=60 /DNA_END=947 /DNA_ORIENTATION=+
MAAAVGKVKEMSKDMAEPEDMSDATCMQKAFVCLRTALYFTAFITLIVSVSVWHIWNDKMLDALNFRTQQDSYEKACVFTDQFATYYKALVEGQNPQPPTDQDYVNKCNFFLYSVVVGTVYAFVFFGITAAIFCNKRVKFKYLEIGELFAAAVLVFSAMVASSLVTHGMSKSCEYYLSDDFCSSFCQRERSSDTCADTVKFVLGRSVASKIADFKDYMAWMEVLRDAMWIGTAAFFLLALILFIRYRTVHRQSIDVSKRKYADLDGESTTEMGTATDMGYDTQESSPTQDEGNPF